MDEAETLGDRIAIMAAGKVKCVGSALFLKSQYGVGYTLTIAKTPQPTAEQSRALDSLIHARCTRAERLSDVGTELTYRMPFEESGNFPELFQSLEQQPERYGIQLFGVSVTTLEEVFLRVGRDHTEADIAADERLQQASFVRQISAEREERAMNSFTQAVEEMRRSGGSQMDEPLTEARRAESSVSFARHVRAMLVKRFHNARRDRKAWCCQIVLPLIFLLVALLTMRFAGIGDYEAVPLSATSLPGPQRFVAGFGESVTSAQVADFLKGASLDVEQ
ncbi:ABCA3, partial [Symbiodinium natans]